MLNKEGWLEKVARKNVGKSLGFIALSAAGALLLPPAGAAIAASFAAGTAAEAVGSKLVHEHLKQKRLKKAERPR
ncbi:MAG TPA: hypothetical protein VGS08_06360 [Candidatus Saccharimonadales bacterium]|nr:hypothetical protein [Candidatus Saccharimonadales bacterium]